MAIAKVNIENVEVFRQSIESQRNAVSDNIEIANSTVNEAKETVNLEKEKALALIDNVQETLSTLKIKIDEQQNKVDQLEAELSTLEASEPTPAEELVVEPDEYDEEGNLISVGSSYYEETFAHISWRNEVAQLEGELQNEEARLSQMQAVQGKLQSILARVEQDQVKLEEIYSKLEANQEEINVQKNSFEGYSEDATDKLNKINSVLQEYASLTIGAGQSFWSKLIYPGVSVSGMSVGKFSPSRVPTMSKAFDSSPEWIRNKVSEYGNKVNVQDKPCRSHYTPSEKQICMDPRYDDDEYAEVFKHEFGHYIDHAHGWVSQSPAFVAAYQKDCENLDITTWDGARNTNKLLTELMNGESAKYDRCISDILSATYKNDLLIQNRFFSEGLSYYQHDNQYWDRGRNRENEVFANLFAIYSNNDTETVEFISKNFPNTDRVFKNLLH